MPHFASKSWMPKLLKASGIHVLKHSFLIAGCTLKVWGMWNCLDTCTPTLFGFWPSDQRCLSCSHSTCLQGTYSNKNLNVRESEVCVRAEPSSHASLFTINVNKHQLIPLEMITYNCRSCQRIMVYKRYLQNQNSPAIAVCTSTGREGIVVFIAGLSYCKVSPC